MGFAPDLPDFQHQRPPCEQCDPRQVGYLDSELQIFDCEAGAMTAAVMGAEGPEIVGAE